MRPDFARLKVFLFAVLPLLFFSSPAMAQDSAYVENGQWKELMIEPPECAEALKPKADEAPLCSEEQHAAWLQDITRWRTERTIRVGYDGSRYEIPALKWTQSSFIQPQMMVEDRYFYDPAGGKYTVDRYVDDLEKRYGGIDAVLIWPTYPNMGIDNRNQHDMIRSMPGGIPGVKKMVADFHRRGVRVFFPMMMWDLGTRDPGMPWTQAIAELMAEIGGDGVNGDTQRGMPRAYFDAAEKTGHYLAFEPEAGPQSDEGVGYNLLTWGQYDYHTIPRVERFKWIETRHMVNISDRWKRDKTDNLQYAFFNGVGWESWENIWGIWNGITPRDAEATRRMAAIERGVAPYLVSSEWEPHVPMLRYGIYASRWPLGGRRVWTIVNRNEYPVEGRQMNVRAEPGTRFYDLYHGVELKPERKDGRATLSFTIEAHGFGAVLAAPGEAEASIKSLMARMKTMTAASLSSYSHEWKVQPQKQAEMTLTKRAASAPKGMVEIPGNEFPFKVQGIEIEGRNDEGVDVQYPWEPSPRRFHDNPILIDRFFMDKFPVTNAQFKEFLEASHYRPADDLNFLRDWKNGTYPEGWAEKPVTWVSLEDARAYAAWAGKRLPHEWEWQYAAQGTDGRLYPWGNNWKAEAVPVPEKGRTLRGPDAVDAHPAGASPFGVMDMVGNVWQWTDEYLDEHTRAGILRGGSYYQPQGSLWYFPQAYRNDQHGKLLLMAPAKDRAATLGFRCVVDAE